MIQVGPVTAYLVDLPHEPLQKVEVVRRLVNQDAAALGVPATAPRVGLIIGSVAPAEHLEDAEHGRADLGGVDGVLHAANRLVEAALADNAEVDARPPRRGEHGITVGQGGGQRFLNQDVNAGLGGRDRGGGV